MTEYRRGAKAGLVAGALTGIIWAIASYALIQRFVDVIRTEIQGALPANSGISVDQLVTFSIYAAVIGAFVSSVIGGIVLGLIFALVEGRYLKNQSIEVRGIVFGLVLWLLELLLGIGNLRYGSAYYATSTVVSIIVSVLFGYLLGRFFQFFGPKAVDTGSYSSGTSLTSFPFP